MPALAWIINLGFAGGTQRVDVTVEPPQVTFDFAVQVPTISTSGAALVYELRAPLTIGELHRFTEDLNAILADISSRHALCEGRLDTLEAMTAFIELLE